MLKSYKAAPPQRLLELHNRCNGDDLHALYATYADILTSQIVGLSHLRQLGYGGSIASLAKHFAEVEDFAVNHLKLEIALAERGGQSA